MKNECEGCFFHPKSHPDLCMFGLVPVLRGTDGCPCRTCIVKSMCDQRIEAVHLWKLNTACEEFVTYVYKSRCKKSFYNVIRELEDNDLSYYERDNKNV